MSHSQRKHLAAPMPLGKQQAAPRAAGPPEPLAVPRSMRARGGRKNRAIKTCYGNSFPTSGLRKSSPSCIKSPRALLQLTIVRLADTGGKRGPAFICARPSSSTFVFGDAARAASTGSERVSAAFGSASCLLQNVAGECACRRGDVCSAAAVLL